MGLRAGAQQAGSQQAGAQQTEAQQAEPQQQDSFHWIDFHSEQDQTYVLWVERALETEKWTAIREIGVLYDAALVVTTTRTSSDASPATDTFNIWSVSLKTRAKTPLLNGANLHWLELMQIVPGQPKEIGMLYDDCRECSATTYFTTFHFDYKDHVFHARWFRGGQATVPVWAARAAPAGVTVTQAYALLREPTDQQEMATWYHYDYGKTKKAEDYVYRYDVDPGTGLERTQVSTAKEADPLKARICAAQGMEPGLARGQDSDMCLDLARGKMERKPVTTPPGHALGRSVPPKGKVH